MFTRLIAAGIAISIVSQLSVRIWNWYLVSLEQVENASELTLEEIQMALTEVNETRQKSGK